MNDSDNITIAQVTQDTQRFLTTSEANQYLTERGFSHSPQWLTRSTVHKFSRYPVGTGYRWDKKELDSFLEEYKDSHFHKPGRHGFISPRRLHQNRNTALTTEEIEEVLNEHGHPWTHEKLRSAMLEFHEYKKEMGHAWRHAKGVKATITLFKGMEHTFPVSVAYAISNECRGAYPKPWLASEDDTAIQTLSQEDIRKAREELGI